MTGQLSIFADWHGAEFSPCRTWRYRLWRRWGPGPLLVVIGLNPSTADETQDDPTIRRCIGYAKDWGFAGLVMLNIFAYRATDPDELRRALDPFGPENVQTIEKVVREVVGEGGAVLAAWGVHGSYKQCGAFIRMTLQDRIMADSGTACLGLTKSGEPRHPLYLPKDAKPVPFTGDGGRLVTQLTLTKG